MFTLPDVQGEYPVGATTFAIPVETKDDASRVVGQARLKQSSGGTPNSPALKLEEVAFTAYYPAEPHHATHTSRTLPKSMHWIARPVSGVLKGYAHFGGQSGWIVNGMLGVLGGVAHLLKIPVYQNARLLDPQHRKDTPNKPWPLVIFSHGLGGTRTNYSHFCRHLAAQGRVVLAIEHRDGTGPFVFARTPSPGVKEETPANCKMYLNPDDVLWDGGAAKTRLALREDQLHFRRLETYIAYTSFKRLVQSKQDAGLDWIHTIDGPWNHSLDDRVEDKAFWDSWLKSNELAKVECDQNLALTGHSFGGATVLSILSQSPPTLEDVQFQPIPFTRAIALDPWLEPLPSPGPAPVKTDPSLKDLHLETPKLLVINSEAFTLWDDHFSRLKDVVKSWADSSKDKADAADGPNADRLGTLVTLVQAQHVSFSDFGVIMPFGKMARDGPKFLDMICDLSDSFIGEGFDKVLGGLHQVEPKVVETKKSGRWDDWGKKFVGEIGDIIVH